MGHLHVPHSDGQLAKPATKQLAEGLRRRGSARAFCTVSQLRAPASWGDAYDRFSERHLGQVEAIYPQSLSVELLPLLV